MKKKNIITSLLFGLALVTGLTACGDNSSNSNNPSTNPPAVEPSTPSTDSSQGTQTEETTELASYKTAANSKLDELVNPFIQKITNDELKAAVQTYRSPRRTTRR